MLRHAGKVLRKRRKPINGWSSAIRDKSNTTIGVEVGPVIGCESLSRGSAFLFCGRRFAHRAASAMEDEALIFAIHSLG